MERLTALLQRQSGVVSRRQVLDVGLDDDFLRSAVRRKDLRRVHEGVYVEHTGPLTWSQRAWAAVLCYWPAALSHESVLVAHELGSRGEGSGERRSPRQGTDLTGPAGASLEPIHVSIDHHRTVTEQPGTRVHRKRDLGRFVQPAREPAQVRLEHAVLDVAAEAKSDEEAIAALCDACRSRRTTAARLAVALRERRRLRRRRFLAEVLEDVGSGAHSLLEHRYLTRVERPHGLPTGKRQRQVRVGRTRAYRDVEYLGLRLVVELDGRLGHEEQQDRWDDLDRDIGSTVAGLSTLRLGWRHVLNPCRTAAAVARMLAALGWRGSPRPCSPRCPVGHDRVGSQGDAA
jgi:very-short-patch-repair endonuclease